jgi:hypothetical protein
VKFLAINGYWWKAWIFTALVGIWWIISFFFTGAVGPNKIKQKRMRPDSNKSKRVEINNIPENSKGVIFWLQQSSFDEAVSRLTQAKKPCCFFLCGGKIKNATSTVVAVVLVRQSLPAGLERRDKKRFSLEIFSCKVSCSEHWYIFYYTSL